MIRFILLTLLIVASISCGRFYYGRKGQSSQQVPPPSVTTVPVSPELLEHEEKRREEKRLEEENKKICSALMEKVKNESSIKLLTLSEDDFAISAGGRVDMIFKTKVPETFFEGFDGIRIEAKKKWSVIKDFKPFSRSLKFLANHESVLLDTCHEAYQQNETSLIFFYTDSVIFKKLSKSPTSQHREIIFKSLNKEHRFLEIVFPIKNEDEI